MKEQMIYFIGDLIVVDLIVIIAGIVPYLFGAKIGYRWRKILWLVLAVRLLIPVRLIMDKFYAEKPAYFVQIEIPSYASGFMQEGIEDKDAQVTSITGTEGTPNIEEINIEKIDIERIDIERIDIERIDVERIDVEKKDIEKADTAEIEDVNIGRTDLERTDIDEVNPENIDIGKALQISDTKHVANDSNARTDAGMEDTRKTFLESVYNNRWLILSLWILVGFGLTDYHIIGFLRIKEMLNIQSHRCEDPRLCNLLEGICREYKLRSVPQIWICRDLSSPMLFGYRHTRLLLPDSPYTVAELNMIFRHELQHEKSGDLWYKLLIMFVCDLYWFDPVLLIMQKLAYQDVECVCDTHVLRGLSAEERKEYGNIVLCHMAKSSAGGIVYGTSIFTGMRAAKLRIRNMFTRKNKWGYVILGVLSLCAVAGSSAWMITRQEEKAKITAEDVPEKNVPESAFEKEEPPLVTFRVEDMDVVHMGDRFDLADYYITNKVTVSNRYYIDEDNVLWGYGRNDYGQLGISDVNVEDFYKDPVKIAEDVLTVDCSVNGYFCVYLTKDGSLYGLGSNMLGLLGAEQDGEIQYYAPVTTPALLMENVAYVRAGMESIAALDRDGNVWWWGQYCGNYHTWVCDHGDYSSAVEDDQNPAKMLYIHPKKILENCIYATTGHTMGAAISADGSLYTWGRNIFGECGTEVTRDDFVRIPQKVLENVRMVWVEKIAFGSLEQEIPEIGWYDTTYDFNLFVQLNDGTLLGVGKDLGEKEKEIAVTGDLVETSASVYSDTFVPIALEEYSESAYRQKLGGLTWGMRAQEVKGFLSRNGFQYFETFDETYSIAVEDCRYYCYFDERGQLNGILLQEGGSRDQRFEMGMTKEEVEKYFNSGFTFEADDGNGIYWSNEMLDGNYYGFVFVEDALYMVYERAQKKLDSDIVS